MPIYDGDQERHDGIPDAVTRLGAKIAMADALIVATPEYPGGISSALKNAIDWLSRMKPMPLAGKHLLLLSAAPGAWGGIRGVVAQPCAVRGAPRPHVSRDDELAVCGIGL